MGKLTAKEVESLRMPGRKGDGDGLWFQVQGQTQRSWLLRYMRSGKAREMGLGAYPAVSLAQARAKAAEARALLAKGIDPIAERKGDTTASQPAGMTFRQAADAFIAKESPSWRNAKHAAQWSSTLKTYAFPTLGALPARQITVADVVNVLTPIWTTKPETASRLRGRIEAALSYAATLEGWSDRRNAASWQGNLQNLLAKRSVLGGVDHHPALPWRDLPAFMVELRGKGGIGAQALEFTILTASRSGTVFIATWGEVDTATMTWTVPDTHMKAGKEHKVPLSAAALAVLDAMRPHRDTEHGDFIFPGDRLGRPMSNMTMTAVLRRMGRTNVSVHGFRSTFADWRADATDHAQDIQQAALAHTLGDKTMIAYQRGTMFEKRRVLMDEWAAYCGSGSMGPGAGD